MTQSSTAPDPDFQAQLFAYTANEGALTTLLTALRRWGSGIVEPIEVELAVNASGSGQATLGDTVATEEASLPDVVVSLCGNDEAELATRLSELRSSASPLLQAPSSVLGAKRYRILDGTGAVRLLYAINRLPHMSREAFHHYWLHRHADIGRRLIAPYSYLQSHSDEAFTESLTAAVGLPGAGHDGVVAIHFPDVEACLRQLGREDVATVALEDERNFIDHSRVLLGYYSLLEV